ncbi:MAG: S9 family peptidase [Myxococcaceae bacterium]|nr:MAG: S9 family peptidase [Myxococcaceae bacterium]
MGLLLQPCVPVRVDVLQGEPVGLHRAKVPDQVLCPALVRRPRVIVPLCCRGVRLPELGDGVSRLTSPAEEAPLERRRPRLRRDRQGLLLRGNALLSKADVPAVAIDDPRVYSPPRVSICLVPRDAHSSLLGQAGVGASLPCLARSGGDFYLPPEAVRGKKVPVIVSYHGGPSNVSTVRWWPYASFFCSLGYAWVEPNVRGSSGYGRAFVMADDGPQRLEALKDIETTGRWVAEQPWADKARLVIAGGSYGGYTTLIGVTRQQTLWRAGLDLFGIANWLTFMKSTSGVIRELFLTEIGDPDKDQALLESLSPIKDADKIRVPLFVYAGANDPRVPRSESDQIVKAVREHGVAVEYMVAANEGHSVARRENQIALGARVARFLGKALGP